MRKNGITPIGAVPFFFAYYEILYFVTIVQAQQQSL